MKFTFHFYTLILLGLVTMLSSCFDKDSDSKYTEVEESKNPLETLNNAIIQNPNEAENYFLRSEIYENRGLFPQAKEDVQRAIGLNPEESKYVSRLGRLKFKTGDMSGAKDNLEASLTLDPKNTEGILLLGELQFVLKEYDLAMKRVNEALRIDDQLKKGYFIKGLIYKELGDTTLAISSLQTVTELDPDDTETFLILGILHAAKSDLLAFDYYDAALTSNENSIEALYNKGVFLQELDSSRAAIATYRKMLEIDSSRAVAYYNIGYVQMSQLLNPDSAIIAFSNAIEKKTDYYQAYYNRGYAKEVSGDVEGALEDYQMTLKFSPNNSTAISGMNRLSN